MPTFVRGDATIYYEEQGAGYPLLLFAPGGMRSRIEFWRRSPFDPLVALSDQFRVIALDQRNAGQSHAPIRDDDWGTYTVDHLALLDHLGIDRCHLLGGCIGSSYCLGLIQAAPARVSASVLQNPIGLSNGNREEFRKMYAEWAAEIAPAHPEADAATLQAFGERLFGGEFVFSASREMVRNCPVPLLVLAGNDNFHPTATAQEIAALAPQAELMLTWRTPDVIEETVRRVRAFLTANTPGTAN